MCIIESLYDVLQIDKIADDREVKKAYVKMLRKYPPEKSPEEFKKIRKAYETLIDPIARAEYDALSQYKDQIDEHDEIGIEALENKDYKRAIKEYKKILIIEPNLIFAKNKLGLALTYDGQFDAALVQFKELIELDSNNSTFYSNLAYVYKEKSDYDKAEEACLKAYELNPINDNVILELSGLYIDKKEFDKAIRFLRKCLRKDKEDPFQDFIYYFEMVKVYVFTQNVHKIDDVIDEIENIIPNEKDAREYVSQKFGNLAYELYKARIYNLSEKIAIRALGIDYSNNTIKEIYNKSSEINKAIGLYNVLLKDRRIISILKSPIEYFLFADEYEEDEVKEKYKKDISSIQRYVEVEFIDVIKAINILKSEYSILYNQNQELYDIIYNVAKENEIRDDKCNILKNYSTVPNSKINTRSEQTNDYDSEKVIIKCENCSQRLRVAKGDGNVTITCPTCHKEFNYTFDTLNSNTSDSNTEINNDQQTNSNSFKFRLVTIVICAIIGAVIIPGIGFFVGGFIGYRISNK